MKTRSAAGTTPAAFARRAGALLLAGLVLPFTGLPVLAADAGTDQPIVASLNPPPDGLSCDQAAGATSVYFQFANPPFQISQISLYLDGKGVPQDNIDEHWPTVTMTRGLHAGTNTVDIVANGDNGQHIERRMVVQVGGASAAGTGVAQVSCSDAAVAQAPQAVESVPQPVDGTAPEVVDQGEVADQPPPPVVVEEGPPVVYEEPPPVVYEYPAPVYVYNPYPVIAIDPWIPFVPLFGFGFFYSHYHPWYHTPQVVVNNYYHGGGWGGGGYHGGGWNGGGWHGGPGSGNGGGWHGPPPGNGGSWHGNPPPGGWQGGNRGPYPAPGGNPGWRGAPRPGPAPQPAFNNAPHPAAPGGGFRPPAPNGGGYRPAAPGGGFRPPPGPAPAPRQPAGQQQRHSDWQGGRQYAAAPQFRPQQGFQNFRPAPQQAFRPAPQFHPGPQQGFRPAMAAGRPMQAAAPQFRGGFGGGFHGGGGGFGGGFHGGGGFHAAPSGGGGGRHH